MVKIEESLFFANTGQMKHRLRRAEAYEGLMHIHPSEEERRPMGGGGGGGGGKSSAAAASTAAASGKTSSLRQRKAATTATATTTKESRLQKQPMDIPISASNTTSASTPFVSPSMTDHSMLSSPERHSSVASSSGNTNTNINNTNTNDRPYRSPLQSPPHTTIHFHTESTWDSALERGGGGGGAGPFDDKVGDLLANDDDMMDDMMVDEDMDDDMVDEGAPQLRAVIFDIENMPKIDASAMQILLEIVEDYHERSIQVCFVKLRDANKPIFLRSGLLGEVVGSDHYFRKISDATRFLQERWSWERACAAAAAASGGIGGMNAGPMNGAPDFGGADGAAGGGAATAAATTAGTLTAATTTPTTTTATTTPATILPLPNSSFSTYSVL